MSVPADNSELERAVQGIVRRELVLSEERIEARMVAVVDDMRSEIRALRRVDEALDARLGITVREVERMAELNQDMIRAGVKQALGEIFSPLRVIGALALMMGSLGAAIALVDSIKGVL